jgi:DNA repair protein RadC
VINAPEPRLKELQDVGDSVITELKLVRAAALRLMRTEIVQRPALSSWKQGARPPARRAKL